MMTIQNCLLSTSTTGIIHNTAWQQYQILFVEYKYDRDHT